MKNYFYIIFLVFVVCVIPSYVLANEECDCFPHPENWDKITEHGVFAKEHGTNPNCTECHDTDLTGGWTGVSCYQCHASYPHTSNWKDVNKHGVYALNNGTTQSCQNECHGTNYKGGYSEVSCYGCHELYPHKTQWSNASNSSSTDYHGKHVMTNASIKKRTCATQCHGGSYDGGLSKIACFDCHVAYPHAFNWSNPKAHGTFANTNGTNTTCSTGCHGMNYNGGQTGLSCYDCHKHP
ncbi:MAG: hypothetical protein ABII18_01240 [bacterium]|nr:hypothetical protein [bacterium]MBU1917129.1 hypothetical protein [bacterium]